jgi:hypothetical protein
MLLVASGAAAWSGLSWTPASQLLDDLQYEFEDSDVVLRVLAIEGPQEAEQQGASTCVQLFS